MQGGILSIDVAPDNENLLATAGADSVVVVFDREASRIRASLAGHSKKINSAPTTSLHSSTLCKRHLHNTGPRSALMASSLRTSSKPCQICPA